MLLAEPSQYIGREKRKTHMWTERHQTDSALKQTNIRMISHDTHSRRDSRRVTHMGYVQTTKSLQWFQDKRNFLVITLRPYDGELLPHKSNISPLYKFL